MAATPVRTASARLTGRATHGDSLEIMPQPGEDRAAAQPWPTYPMLFRVASAHEEGGERVYAVSTKEILGEDGKVCGIRVVDVAWATRDSRRSRAPSGCSRPS